MNVFDIEGIIPLVLSLVRRASSGHLMLFPWICAFLEKHQVVIWCFSSSFKERAMSVHLTFFFMLPPSQKEHQVATQDFFCVLNGNPTHFLFFLLMGRKPRFFPRIVFCQKSIG
jgi:hypothetical protein